MSLNKQRASALIAAALSGAILLIAQSAFAESTSGSLLRLRFRDSETGAAVVPTSVRLDSREIASLSDQYGRINTYAADGEHQLVIEAPGYKQMVAREQVTGQDTPIQVIMLDPVQPPAEITGKFLSQFSRPDSSVIAGYIVDEENSQLLEDVTVAVSGSNLSTKTNERGFFALSIPLPDAGPMPEAEKNQKFAKRNIIFSKPGYGAEERRNVLLITSEPKIFHIRLAEGVAPVVLDESKTRGGLQRWLFESGTPDEHDHEGEHADEAPESEAKLEPGVRGLVVDKPSSATMAASATSGTKTTTAPKSADETSATSGKAK